MKRAIVALCALAFVAGMVSCQKDKNEDVTPTGGGNSYTDPTYVEGVFNPGNHLATIVGPGLSEQWDWSNGNPQQLTGISDVVMSTSYNFSYQGDGRLVTSTFRANDGSYAYSYDYDGNVLNSLAIRKNGALWANGRVSHSGDHVSQIDYTNLSTDFIKTMAGQFLNRDLSNTSFSVDDPAFIVEYTWDGDNVTTDYIEAVMSGRITLSQLYDIFGDEISGSSLGQYAALLPLLIQNMGDSSYFYSVDIAVTTQYSYDKKYNPYRGFWGDGLLMNTKVMSANNITAVTSSGTAHFVSNVVLHLPAECPAWVPSQYQSYWFILQPLLDGMNIPIDQTIPLDKEQHFTYTYNSTGFPTSFTTEEDKTYTLTYKEK